MNAELIQWGTMLAFAMGLFAWMLASVLRLTTNKDMD